MSLLSWERVALLHFNPLTPTDFIPSPFPTGLAATGTPPGTMQHDRTLAPALACRPLSISGGMHVPCPSGEPIKNHSFPSINHAERPQMHHQATKEAPGELEGVQPTDQ